MASGDNSNSSAITHPAAHISTAGPYRGLAKSSSGAARRRVARAPVRWRWDGNSRHATGAHTSVPSRCHLKRQVQIGRRSTRSGRRQSARNAKVTQPQRPARIDEDVGRFDILRRGRGWRHAQRVAANLSDVEARTRCTMPRECSASSASSSCFASAATSASGSNDVWDASKRARSHRMRSITTNTLLAVRATSRTGTRCGCAAAATLSAISASRVASGKRSACARAAAPVHDTISRRKQRSAHLERCCAESTAASQRRWRRSPHPRPHTPHRRRRRRFDAQEGNGAL